MEGIVTLVQESRFQVTDDAGISHLFILASSAAAEPGEMAPLQREQARVRVRYRRAPDVLANIAHAVERCARNTTIGARA